MDQHIQPLTNLVGQSENLFSKTYLLGRASCRLMLTILHIVLGLAFGSLVFPWLMREQRLKVRQWWSLRLLGVMGMQFEVRHGMAPSESVKELIVSNHVSFIDIVLINALLPSTFVSKDDVARWPIIGSLARHAETIFIERGSRRAAQRTRELMTAHFCSGQRIAIFPEGTTSSGSHVLPFHAALFQAAVDTDTPVVCLAISYLKPNGLHSDCPAFIGDMSFFECLWRTLSSEGIHAHIQHVQTLTAPHSSRQQLAHDSRYLIAQSREKLARNRPRMPTDMFATVSEPSEMDFLAGTVTLTSRK